MPSTAVPGESAVRHVGGLLTQPEVVQVFQRFFPANAGSKGRLYSPVTLSTARKDGHSDLKKFC
jgi:hypothetical protein